MCKIDESILRISMAKLSRKMLDWVHCGAVYMKDISTGFDNIFERLPCNSLASYYIVTASMDISEFVHHPRHAT